METKNRPELTRELTGEEFARWYFLKEELAEFCRANKIPASGSKEELASRIREQGVNIKGGKEQVFLSNCLTYF